MMLSFVEVRLGDLLLIVTHIAMHFINKNKSQTKTSRHCEMVFFYLLHLSQEVSDTPAAKRCTPRCLLSQQVLMRALKMTQTGTAQGMKDVKTQEGSCRFR